MPKHKKTVPGFETASALCFGFFSMSIPTDFLLKHLHQDLPNEPLRLSL